jgi:hypothetical protein
LSALLMVLRRIDLSPKYDLRWSFRAHYRDFGRRPY